MKHLIHIPESTLNSKEALEWMKLGNYVTDENGHYSIKNGQITLEYHDGVDSPIYNPPNNNWVFQSDDDFLKSKSIYFKV